MEKYDCIRPGKIWLDTNGKRIQAHGGGIIYVDDKFYWYGENKEKTTNNFGVWHWGVRLYSSADLYNWTDEGIICFPELNDKDSPLYPESKMDRPHILYNKKTQKYVMWLKIMESDFIQHMVVAQADSIKGPFKIVNNKLHPGGMNSGDFDLVKLDDGSAYIVFDRVHCDMVVLKLTDDYLDTTLEYSTHYYRRCPPYVREAPAVFFRKGKGYIFTSGTTGYFPNQSEVATFDTIHGEWTVLGDPHMNDERHTSFGSQICSVFKHPYVEDLYIALADRWLTDLPADLPNMTEVYAACFDNQCDTKIKEKYCGVSPDSFCSGNTSCADYVWLPIVFEGDVPRLYWKDEWRINDYGYKANKEA